MLTCAHLVLNYCALKILALRSINVSRLDVLMHRFVALPCVEEALELCPRENLSGDSGSSDGTIRLSTNNCNGNGSDPSSSAPGRMDPCTLARAAAAQGAGGSMAPAAVAAAEPIISPLLPPMFQPAQAIFGKHVSLFASPVDVAVKNPDAVEAAAHPYLVLELEKMSHARANSNGAAMTRRNEGKHPSVVLLVREGATQKQRLLGAAEAWLAAVRPDVTVAVRQTIAEALYIVLQDQDYDLERIQLEGRSPFFWQSVK